METKRSCRNGSEGAAERKPTQSPEATAALLGVNTLCLCFLLVLLRTATTTTNPYYWYYYYYYCCYYYYCYYYYYYCYYYYYYYRYYSRRELEPTNAEKQR